MSTEHNMTQVILCVTKVAVYKLIGVVTFGVIVNIIILNNFFKTGSCHAQCIGQNIDNMENRCSLLRKKHTRMRTSATAILLIPTGKQSSFMEI